ncbi:MAG TPA: C39 family peptidase [Thermoanaerobaculia bacterium]|nr:C39 family peptidase [Thermoanaerobaculia bacterium]
MTFRALLLVSLLSFPGCNLGGNPDFRLGVPYHSQPPASFYCGPASVQMWADYDYDPPFVPTQEEIAQWMGGVNCGSSEEGIRQAVNRFTATSDAVWDFDGDINFAPFMSRQITSIDNYFPVIAILDGGLHAGVVNGGKWHALASEGYQWDYVYFHDPLERADVYYTSAIWIERNCPVGSTCSQIISHAATLGAATNLNRYGSDIYDSSGCHVTGCGPKTWNEPPVED